MSDAEMSHLTSSGRMQVGVCNSAVNRYPCPLWAVSHCLARSLANAFRQNGNSRSDNQFFLPRVGSLACTLARHGGHTSVGGGGF